MNDSALKLLVIVTILIILVKTILYKLFGDMVAINRIRKKGISTEGIVIGINQKEDVDGYTQFAKIIRFIAEPDREIILQSEDFSFRKPIVGTKVKLVYSLEDPYNAVENPYNLFLFKLFLFVFTLLVIISIAFGLFLEK